MTKVVVFGATGFTGMLIVERLARAGIPFAVAGRHPVKVKQLGERLGGVACIVADAKHPRSLAPLMEETTLIINCVGPFLRYGEVVLQAALEHGVHYLDTTGEQPWMKLTWERYHHVALDKRLTVINATAFEYAIGDWLAACVAEPLKGITPVESIKIGYRVRGGGMSHGTALSIFEMWGRQGWSYEQERWQPRPIGWHEEHFRFPDGEDCLSWVPFGEIVTVPRHQRVENVSTYIRLPAQLSRFLPYTNRLGSMGRYLLRPFAKSYISRRARGPSKEERLRSRFTLVAEAQRGDETCRAYAQGRDPYGLTADIAVLAAELLLTRPASVGVQTPAHLPIMADEALASLNVVMREM